MELDESQTTRSEAMEVDDEAADGASSSCAKHEKRKVREWEHAP